MSDLATQALVAARPALFFYSPVNFIREIPAVTQLKLLVAELVEGQSYWAAALPAGSASGPGGEEVRFYYQPLPWDTAYFGLSTYKLNLVLFPAGTSAASLMAAAREFLAHLRGQGAAYVFMEVPAEDTALLQALTGAGLRLIETRLSYYRALVGFAPAERYPVRAAGPADVPDLQAVARTMRNAFDRFHADPVFAPAQADEFLATYVAESVRGFADLVLVPDVADGHGPGAFLTARYCRAQWAGWGVPVSKMVLSAVSAQTRPGWYRKLVSELSLHLREQGTAYAYLNTQATNRAVFHTWESLGYKLGGTTHVLAVAL